MRIVVRGPDARSARDAQAQLAAAGFSATALIGDGPAPDGEDVSIVVGPTPFRRAEAPPLLRLAGLTSADPPPPGLRGLEGFSGAIALDAPARLLTAQVDAALRLAIIEEERARRAATAASLQAPAPRTLEARKPRALYIGAPSAMFLALERALTEHGGLVAAAFSSYAGFDHLHDEPFDAVVLNGAENAPTAISLCAALRRNASLYYLPTMVVTAPGDAATAAAAIERGAAAVAEANAPCGPSLGWLFEAVRRERRRRSAEHDVRAMRDLMGDPRTGLFQRAAFDAHLARLAADHHANGRPMSLVALRVLPAHGARQPSPETWRRGFGEIASLAGRLMRDADCGATLGGDLIAVALPASDLAAAKRTAERIASVSECTAFASGENSAGPLVFEQFAAELQPGESGAGLLARALRSLEVEEQPA
jgi:two-component system cell cycle response regulator PopA